MYPAFGDFDSILKIGGGLLSDLVDFSTELGASVTPLGDAEIPTEDAAPGCLEGQLLFKF